ncbi:MAG: hypothetical protein ACC645_01565 [Pirellulales bacterium]
MLHRGSYRWLATSLAIVPLLTVPAESQACCFTKWLCHRRSTPTFQPVVAAPAYQPQTVQYVPQTCYRAVRQNVPVTTCRAVTTRDPCTGCPITSMQPVTTYVQQVRYVPYTTYRAVTVPARCATTAAYAAPGCATGGCGTTTPSYAAPSTGTPSYAPAPVTSPVPQSPTPSLVPAPTSPATPSAGSPGSPQPTFQKPVVPNSGVPNNADGELEPEPASSSGVFPAFPPSNTKSTNDRRPKLFDPRDRTARSDADRMPRPGIHRLSVSQVRPAVHLERASFSEASPARPQERLDAAGWRAASR